MLMLDYLVENKAILSKASFIREVVGKAAEAEVARLWKVRDAVRLIDEVSVLAVVRKSPVQNKRSFYISLVRLLWSSKEPKKMRFFADLNSSGPLAMPFGIRHSFEAASVVFSNQLVKGVLATFGMSQVLNAVVRSIAIDVVDLRWRHHSMHIKPCKPVS